MSAARLIKYLPPQQKPAAPIFRFGVGNGGGEVRRAWKKEKMRGLATDGRLRKNQGRIMDAA